MESTIIWRIISSSKVCLTDIPTLFQNFLHDSWSSNHKCIYTIAISKLYLDFDFFSTKLFILFFLGIISTVLLTTSMINPVYSSFSNMTTPPKNSTPQNNPENLSTNYGISDEIRDAVKSLVSNSNSTNAAVVLGYIDPNGIQFYGYGNKSGSTNVTADQNTIFGIGSITKVFTTILLADMMNDGLIKLNDPLKKYLPTNVTVPQYGAQNMTLENLATHTAGLPEFPDNFCKDYWNNFDANQTTEYRMEIIECSQEYSPSELFQGLSNTTISTEFGSKFGYSSFGTGLLGNILALKSNMSYDDLLEKRILSVLGMVNTSITLSEEQKSNVAVGHINGDELPLWNLAPVMTPSGGIYSTANDMLKFLSANMGLIKTKLDTAMQESHLIRHYNGFLGPNNVQVSDNNSGEGFYVGLGWMINTNYGSEVVWHNGITADGYNSIIAFNPSTLKGIVLLSSADHKDIDVANIGLLHKEGFANLIWKLLY